MKTLYVKTLPDIKMAKEHKFYKKCSIKAIKQFKSLSRFNYSCIKIRLLCRHNFCLIFL